jgi:hypothetical protein
MVVSAMAGVSTAVSTVAGDVSDCDVPAAWERRGSVNATTPRMLNASEMIALTRAGRESHILFTFCMEAPLIRLLESQSCW